MKLGLITPGRLLSRVSGRLVVRPLVRWLGDQLLRYHYRERFAAWRREQAAGYFNDYPNPAANYHDRYDLYAAIVDRRRLEQTPLTYLEFGVASGASIRWWLSHASHPDARFVGFDVFTGLPEDWESKPRGSFSTGGEPPPIDDARCRFVSGLFQDSVPGFLEREAVDAWRRPLIVHLDADLYTSTLFVLFQLRSYLRPGDILLFDEFTSYEHEFRALEDFTAATGLGYEFLGAINNYRQVGLEVL